MISDFVKDHRFQVFFGLIVGVWFTSLRFLQIYQARFGSDVYGKWKILVDYNAIGEGMIELVLSGALVVLLIFITTRYLYESSK